MPDQIYLFFGEEDLSIQNRVKELKSEIADPALNLDEFDAEEPDTEKIVSALKTTSLLGGDRLVIVRKVDLKHKEWDKIVPHLKELPAGTKVVFWADKVDKRSKLYKVLDKLGEVSEFKEFAEWEQDKVVAWITRQVKSLGKEIEPAAAENLQQICGSRLRKLSSEIEKLVTYIGAKKSIEKEDVAALASPGDINTFALANAIIDKDLKQSLKFFRILYKNKADVFGLLGLLATQYRTILQVKSVPGTANNAFKIAQTIGANPYFVKKCLAKSGKFAVPELIADLELILQTGLKLKSGEDQLTIFELLLSSLCGS